MTARRMHIAQEWPVVVFGGGAQQGALPDMDGDES
jgi:hypothetical protein